MEFNKSKNEDNKLSLLNSPYFVPHSKKIEQVIQYAINMGLLGKYSIDYSIIEDYFDKKIRLPIWIVEAACRTNLKDKTIPIEYQYLWFCLNHVKIRRIKNNRVFNPKVVCYPIYIDINREIAGVIKEATEKVGSIKSFAPLVNRSPSRVSDWINMNIKVPITALFKACQVLNRNPWNLLENKIMCGQSEGEGILFKNINIKDIVDILLWLKFEGHISLSHARVEIEQKREGKEALLNIAKRIKNEFNVLVKIMKRKNKDHYILRINSSVFKQILWLKYGIGFGFKSSDISIKNELGNINDFEDKMRILAAAMETEGHFGVSKVNNSGYPRYNFTSLSKIVVDEIDSIFKNELKLNSVVRLKDNEIWRTSIRNFDDCIRLVYYLLPYLYHRNKVNNITKFFRKRDILNRRKNYISNNKVENSVVKLCQNIISVKEFEKIRNKKITHISDLFTNIPIDL
jgi:hypothetical protein